MIVRILVSLALIVFACGFTWFAAQVIWLGTKEFFRIHGKSSATSATPSVGSSTTTVAP